MRTETVIVGTDSEILDYFKTLDIKPEGYVGIGDYNREHNLPIFTQIYNIKTKDPRFGMVYWLNFKEEEKDSKGISNVTISIQKQFVLINLISDEEMKKELFK